MDPQRPPRKRMKSGITRVRTGCYTCRRRKVKCDEEKPECRACSQLGLCCEGYALRYKFCDPQTSETPQWATTTTTAPKRGSEPQQPSSFTQLESSNQPLPSVNPQSASIIGHESRLPSTTAGTWTTSEPSVVYTPPSSSPDRPDTGIHAQPSFFGGSFLDNVANWTRARNFTLESQEGRTRHTNDQADSSSSDTTTSPSDYGDASYTSLMPGSRLNHPIDQTYEASVLIHTSNPSSLDEYYFAQWHNGVAPLLPPVFREITTVMPEFQPLRNAVLAISAAYVAHSESLVVRNAHRNRYLPQKDHQYQSLQYYNKVIQGISKSVEMLPHINSLHVLAALLLSYYFELDSGSFTGGIGHMTVIDKFLSSHHNVIKSHPTGPKLLSTWMNLRSQFVNRYLGSYTSSAPTLSIDTFPLNRKIDHGVSHRDSITIMLCDAKLLSRRIILDWCVARGESRDTNENSPFGNILTQISLPKTRTESASELAAIDNSYQESLAKQRATLDDWHSTLDLSELPIESYVSQRQDSMKHSITESDMLEIRPLKFQSFDAAMNYANYAHAHMMCSQDAIDRLLNPEFVVPPLTRKDCPWPELILRITAGLQLADCVYKNTFNAGILSILTTCIVLCPRADVAAWIQEWIRKVEDLGVPLENGLPFGIIKRIIRFVLTQREDGNDVLLIVPLDTEQAEKSDLYHSDYKMKAAVCGKRIYTGKLYSEITEVPEE